MIVTGLGPSEKRIGHACVKIPPLPCNPPGTSASWLRRLSWLGKDDSLAEGGAAVKLFPRRNPGCTDHVCRNNREWIPFVLFSVSRRDVL